jgi:hypothetical protein
MQSEDSSNARHTRPTVLYLELRRSAPRETLISRIPAKPEERTSLRDNDWLYKVWVLHFFTIAAGSLCNQKIPPMLGTHTRPSYISNCGEANPVKPLYLEFRRSRKRELLFATLSNCITLTGYTFSQPSCDQTTPPAASISPMQ